MSNSTITVVAIPRWFSIWFFTALFQRKSGDKGSQIAQVAHWHWIYSLLLSTSQEEERAQALKNFHIV